MQRVRHLISPDDLSMPETDAILDLADEIAKSRERFAEVCKQKTIATLFFEPSTRTRLSFEAAMLELGGSVLGFSTADASSTAKGETVADTVRTVSCFADIIAMRHPKEGSASVAASVATVPLINGGDGGHQHPTQTLTDLLTIRSLRQNHSLENFTIGLCGDLMFGRTVHSLARALMKRKGVKFVLISPKELRLPGYLLDEMRAGSVAYEEVEKLDDVMGRLDVLYMTRVQRERFFNEEDYVRLRDFYILDAAKMEKAKADMMVLHPLPRVSEISPDVDADPRAAYFKQVLFGKIVRKALIITLLGLEVPK